MKKPARSGGHSRHGGWLPWPRWVIQRFGGGLSLNVHYHSRVLDGVFTESADGTLRFLPAPVPTDEEVARLMAMIVRRVRRLLERRGIDEEGGDGATDPLGRPADAKPVAADGRSPRVLTGGRSPLLASFVQMGGGPRRCRAPNELDVSDLSVIADGQITFAHCAALAGPGAETELQALPGCVKELRFTLPSSHRRALRVARSGTTVAAGRRQISRSRREGACRRARPASRRSP